MFLKLKEIFFISVYKHMNKYMNRADGRFDTRVRQYYIPGPCARCGVEKSYKIGTFIKQWFCVVIVIVQNKSKKEF